MKKMLTCLLVLLCGCSQTNQTTINTGGSEQIKIAILYDENYQVEARQITATLNQNGYSSAQKEEVKCKDEVCIIEAENLYNQHVDVFVGLGGYSSDVLNELKNANDVPIFTLEGNWMQFLNYQKDKSYAFEADIIQQLFPDLSYAGILEYTDETTEITVEQLTTKEDEILSHPIDGSFMWYYTGDVELIPEYDFRVPFVTFQSFDKALLSFEYDRNEMAEIVAKDIVSYLKNEEFETDVFMMKATIHAEQIAKYGLEIAEELKQYVK